MKTVLRTPIGCIVSLLVATLSAGSMGASAAAQSSASLNPCESVGKMQQLANKDPTTPYTFRLVGEQFSACTWVIRFDDYTAQCRTHLQSARAFQRAALLEAQSPTTDKIIEVYYWERADDEYSAARFNCKRAGNDLALQDAQNGASATFDFLSAHIK